MVQLPGEPSVFVLKVVVAVDFHHCCGVIEAVGFFNKGVETSIPTCEDGKEPRSCCLSNGGLSIVRPEEKLCDIGGFPRLPPSLSPPDQRLPWWRAWSNELREEMYRRRRNRRVPPGQVELLAGWEPGEPTYVTELFL